MSARLIVGIGQVAFIGAIVTVPEHRCLVPVIGAGLDREFELVTASGVEQTRLQMVASRVSRRVNAFGSRLAVIPVDPGTRFAGEWDLPQTLSTLRDLANTFDDEHWCQLRGALGIAQYPLRLPEGVRKVCELIVANLEQNLSAPELAEEACLSVSRLEHSFADALGVPLRSYRTWHRLRLVARSLAQGFSLTEAAHRAGFHDSAHLSNTFSKVFGLPPSAIFSPALKIHLPTDPLTT